MNSAYVTMNVLGLFSHHFFFAFALLDLVNRFEELKLVLLAVYRPAKALMLTALLFLVFEYFFAILGFTYLQYVKARPKRITCADDIACAVQR